MSGFRRHAVRSYLASGLLALVLSVRLTPDATAQDFNPADLTAEDQSLMQQMLENERSHVPRSLPVSESIFTIIRTETQPRICRFFVLQELGGDQHQGVGCRVGTGLWQLAATMRDMGQATAPVASAGPSVSPAPRTVTVIRPTTSQPEAIASADTPPTWSTIPVPTRRPARDVAVVTDDAAGDATDDTVIEAGAPIVPAAFAAVPLPSARPIPPGGFVAEQPTETDVGSPAPDGPEALPTLPLNSPEPEETVIAAEEDTVIDVPDAAVIAEGDTDISAERGDALLADPELAELDTGGPLPEVSAEIEQEPSSIEATPIETPLPARRP